MNTLTETQVSAQREEGVVRFRVFHVQLTGGGGTATVKRVKEKREVSRSESKARSTRRSPQFCPIWYGMLRHLSHVM